MQRREFLKLGATLSAVTLLPSWSRFAFAQSNTPSLAIPPQITPDAQQKIVLNIQQGISKFIPTANTTTWGYNGSLLGPALKLKRGQPVTININNQLPETTTVHWHGLEISGEEDGGPQAMIEPENLVLSLLHQIKLNQRVGSILILMVLPDNRSLWD